MIILERPPNFQLIESAFPKSTGPGVLFAYDGNIYNPSGITVPPALVAHENVHLERQQLIRGGNQRVEQWWRRYIEDSEFRYNEELLAHAAEFKVLRVDKSQDRNFGARLLISTALRLVAPLYNYQPPRTLQQAMKDLRKEIEK
jgi:hypothetical protein